MTCVLVVDSVILHAHTGLGQSVTLDAMSYRLC